jgi:hypothetical protein
VAIVGDRVTNKKKKRQKNRSLALALLLAIASIYLRYLVILFGPTAG